MQYTEHVNLEKTTKSKSKYKKLYWAASERKTVFLNKPVLFKNLSWLSLQSTSLHHAIHAVFLLEHDV